MKTDPDGLNNRQRLFADAVLTGSTATKAAETAGYSPKSAAVTGSRVLRNAKVAAVLAEKQEAAAVRAEVQAADVIRELGRIAFSDISHFVTWGGEWEQVDTKRSTELSDDDRHCVAEFVQSAGGVRFKLHNKLPALLALGRYFGLFTERSNIEEIEHITDAELEAEWRRRQVTRRGVERLAELVMLPRQLPKAEPSPEYFGDEVQAPAARVPTARELAETRLRELMRARRC